MITSVSCVPNWRGADQYRQAMLKELHIRNFAIIDEVELLFAPGMTVLTGETGTGKSILIDAIGLILGDRADAGMIREEEDRAEIIAVFDIPNGTAVETVLDEQAIEADDTGLTIRRIISRDGRSRALINGSPVSVQTLKIIGEFLIDIHGQHAHQSLMRRPVQRALLDHFAGHSSILEEVKSACQQWQTATTRLEELDTAASTHQASLELLQYQVQELEELAPQAGEFVKLEGEYKRLANTSRLLETTRQALDLLNESEYSIDTQLGRMLRELQESVKFDSALDRVIELLEAAQIQLSEATDELKHYLDRLELNPEQLHIVETRLNVLHDMARKHHVDPQLLPEHLHTLRQQLDHITNAGLAMEKLREEQARALARYREAAEKLHQSRLQAAASMAGKIGTQLKQLGIPDSVFHIEVTGDKSLPPRMEGFDQVEYLVSANPGQPPQALRKVASGGELSRISLAVQVISKEVKTVPTLIFDEVDAGIGGGTAEIVGKLLSELAAQQQVFCVTHLAQIAVRGDHHLSVSKTTNNRDTVTQVTGLNANDRVEEIARMLGGLRISEKTRAHAREMLDHSDTVNTP